MASDAKPLRCAIYTRKSTEHGLEQEFNSLDAQREASEAYIASQRSEGWTCLTTRYDDGAIPAATPTGRPCSAYWRTSRRAGSMPWSSISWTASAARSWTSPR